MRTMTKLRRSTRGLSPIFATLILIAIAVIAGIVVYMFASGFIATLTGGGPAAQEKAAVSGVNPAGIAYASYIDGGPDGIDITGVIVKDQSGNTVGTPSTGALGTLTPDGALVGITFAPPGAAGTYTVTLVSSNGGNFLSPSFVIGP